jgi:parallel beta-helix repeat protein
MISRLLAVIPLILTPALAHGTTLHVPSEYPRIQDGLDAASPGDTVLVEPGTYTGTRNRNLDFQGKNLVLLSSDGPERTTIDCQSLARAVYFHLGESHAAVFRGFTIKRGHTMGTDAGGGIRCSESSPTIADCIITDCESPLPYGAGGIACRRSSARILDCEIRNNDTGNDGGGIYCYEESNTEIINCTITGNNADDAAGGIGFADSSRGEVIGCRITDNRSGASRGGGVFTHDSMARIHDCDIADNSGHGLYSSSIDKSIFSHCRVTGNWQHGVVFKGSEATLSGCLVADSGVYGVWCSEDYSSPTLSDCTISENQDVGVRIRQSGVVLLRCVIAGNGNGGIHTYGYYPAFIDCVIVGNARTSGSGAGIACVNSIPSIVGCTIAGNMCGNYGGGIFLGLQVHPTIVRTILWGNCAGLDGDQVYVDNIAIPELVCCAVDPAGVAGGPVHYNGEQVFSDPLFCDPATCWSAPTEEGDYSLRGNSPCRPGSSPCGELIGALSVSCFASSVPGDILSAPKPVILLGPKPNPSSGPVVLDLNLTHAERVRVAMYDVRGRLIQRLSDGKLPAGRHTITLEPTSTLGSRLGNGVYYVRLDAGGVRETRSIVITK